MKSQDLLWQIKISLWTVKIFMMTDQDFIMNSWDFIMSDQNISVDRLRFSWWTGQCFVMNCEDFQDDKLRFSWWKVTKFLWWEVKIFLVTGQDFIINSWECHDDRSRFYYEQQQLPGGLELHSRYLVQKTIVSNLTVGSHVWIPSFILPVFSSFWFSFPFHFLFAFVLFLFLITEYGLGLYGVFSPSSQASTQHIAPHAVWPVLRSFSFKV